MACSNVNLIWSTINAETLVAYCARVSNPANQDNPDYEGLLKYCITHGHWSVFEMANLCLEINTSRAISAQILRHRSFSFQEFSQRYAETTTLVEYEARRQDIKNRQNSIDDLPTGTKEWFKDCQQRMWMDSYVTYRMALDKGIAKECARMLLPMSTSTTLYMNGTIRSWIHYFNLRCDVATQLEHREIALQAREIFKEEFPTISKILEY